MAVTQSQYLATAAHHEKMARIFQSVGRKDDAKAALAAADLARCKAKEMREKVRV